MNKRILAILLTVCMFLSATATVLAESEPETEPYLITDAEDLATFRDAVNSGDTYIGKTVRLTNDIVLSGEWTPIGNGTRNGSGYAGNVFKGTFDGGDHTISGLNITTADQEKSAVGLFGVVAGGTVKNLTLSEVEINVSISDTVGAAIGLMVENATAENISVSGTLSAPDAVGGVIGRMTISGMISNCVNSASVTGKAVGGIVCKAYYTGIDMEMTITDCSNSGTITSNRGTDYAGGIASFSAANVKNCTNSGTVTVTNDRSVVGGIVGVQTVYGTVSGNKNTADLTVLDAYAPNTIGGIVGWINYQNIANGATASYERYEIISVKDNSNSGKIGGNSKLGSGGIVGNVYNAAVITGNTNTAESIRGYFASGIVGAYQVQSNNGYYSDPSLTVSGNTTTTAIENITGSFPTLFCYDNTQNNNASIEGSNAGPDTVAVIKGETPADLQAFDSLQAAFTAAVSDDTVLLLQDTKTDIITIPDGKSVALNLNGCTITPVEAFGKISKGIFAVERGAAFTIDDSSEKKSGKIESGQVYAAVVMTTKEDTNTNGIAKLTVNGGTLTGCYYAIAGNGSRNGTEITINGGTIRSSDLPDETGVYKDGLGIFHPQSGTLTINGGLIQGATGIEMRAGTLIVNGGVITSTETSFHATPNGSGSTTSGAAVALSQHNTGLETSVIVKGGTLNAGGSAYALYQGTHKTNGSESTSVTVKVENGSINGSVKAEKTDVITIEGGSFSDDTAKAYLSSGSTLVPTKDSEGNTVYILADVYTVSFDANDGSGEMNAVTVVSGETYSLPACSFTAPENKQFKAWSIDGIEKTVGDTITVTEDITVTAVWEDSTAPHTCTPALVEKVEPTCTTAGKEAYYECRECGKIYEDALGEKPIEDLSAWGNLDALGHDFADATCTDPKTCKRDGCGATEGEPVADAHKFRWVTDESGNLLSMHKECSICGYAQDVPGDVNGNGLLDALDYLKIRRAFFELTTLTEEQLALIDFNGNGKIDAVECIKLRRVYFSLSSLEMLN